LIHDRHFTLAEANALLPRVDPMIRALRAARDQLTDTELHEVLAEAAPANGGGDPGRQVGEAFLAVRSLLAELQALGLVIRDLDRGLVDFPAIIDGREVYLCWEVGEDTIEFWHDLEAGYGGRRPLSDSGEGP
jgi:hypothetical protein